MSRLNSSGVRCDPCTAVNSASTGLFLKVVYPASERITRRRSNWDGAVKVFGRSRSLAGLEGEMGGEHVRYRLGCDRAGAAGQTDGCKGQITDGARRPAPRYRFRVCVERHARMDVADHSAGRDPAARARFADPQLVGRSMSSIPLLLRSPAIAIVLGRVAQLEATRAQPLAFAVM
jgi:hypothetical protein